MLSGSSGSSTLASENSSCFKIPILDCEEKPNSVLRKALTAQRQKEDFWYKIKKSNRCNEEFNDCIKIRSPNCGFFLGRF